jgi:hypothetical protein
MSEEVPSATRSGNFVVKDPTMVKEKANRKHEDKEKCFTMVRNKIRQKHRTKAAREAAIAKKALQKEVSQATLHGDGGSSREVDGAATNTHNTGKCV